MKVGMLVTRIFLVVLLGRGSRVAGERYALSSVFNSVIRQR